MAEKLKALAICLGIAVGFGGASGLQLQFGYRFYGFATGAVGLSAVIAASGGSRLKSTCPQAVACAPVLQRLGGDRQSALAGNVGLVPDCD
jgi:hypothetical protein